MKVLFYDFGAYTQQDISKEMELLGIEVINIFYKLDNVYEDKYFNKRIEELLDDTYDAVFSVNFFPVLAYICKNHHIKYISWTYDSPLNVENIEQYLAYETSYAFFFDRIEANKLQKKGLSQVYHLPLAVNTNRIDNLLKTGLKQNDKYRADISMVGQLYDSVLPDLMYGMGEYEKGYISAILESQLQLYGVNIISDSIDQSLVNKINNSFKEKGLTTPLALEGLRVTIAKQITHIERTVILDTLSQIADVKLFGPNNSDEIPNVKYCGSASYFDEMPKVFANSKINLNITLKCIESGIPLRVLDILGSGGFLITNHQPEIAEFFEDCEDLVMYSSMEEAIMKCQYYLEHDAERKRIAQNGYNKVKKLFNYTDRIKQILEVVGCF